MKHAANQTLHAYWNGLRGDRAAPERGDIDPPAIRGVLADTFLIEVETFGNTKPADLTVRLGGTRVNALFAQNIKGQSFWSWWQPHDLDAIQAVVRGVLDDARPAVLGAIGQPIGAPALRLELLLLPLRHRGKTHARMLAGLSPATIPDWLGLLPIGPLSVTSYRMIDDRPSILPERLAPIRTPSTLTSRRAQPSRRGQFFIYDGGRATLHEEPAFGLSPN